MTDVPKLGLIAAYGCAFLNLVVPGGGTILTSFLSDKNINKTQLFFGLA